jgi:drug/metabolite transporter (DMT)-like permease
VNGIAWGYVFVVLAVLSWAGNAIVGRLAPDAGIPPIALNFWRWFGALIVLAPFGIGAMRAQWRLLFVHWRLVMLFGAAGIAGFNALLYLALEETTVVQATLISAILPALVIASARVFLGQPIGARQVAGVLLSFAGVAVIVARGDPAVLLGLVLNRGDLWMLIAVCFWAAQTLLLRFIPKEIDLFGFQLAAIVAGLIVALPFYLAETWGGRPMPFTWTALLMVGYIAVVASAMGYTLWNVGVIRIGPKSAGYFGNLYPVFGAMLGIVLLGEPLHGYHAVGGAVVLAGILLATLRGKAAT